MSNNDLINNAYLEVELVFNIVVSAIGDVTSTRQRAFDK
jgi:cell division protein FtsL